MSKHTHRCPYWACNAFVGRARTRARPMQNSSQQGRCRRTTGCCPGTVWQSSVGRPLPVQCPDNRIPPNKGRKHRSHRHKVQPWWLKITTNRGSFAYGVRSLTCHQQKKNTMVRQEAGQRRRKKKFRGQFVPWKACLILFASDYGLLVWRQETSHWHSNIEVAPWLRVDISCGQSVQAPLLTSTSRDTV